VRTTKSKFNLGVVANCKNIFTLKRADIPGGPDGMTIDTDGNLWIAIFGGDRIIKIDPRKPETLLESIKLPAHQVNNSDVCSSCVKYNIFQVTSAAWGGPT
jgi:sugar lactone lactonase YvrE